MLKNNLIISKQRHFFGISTAKQDEGEKTEIIFVSIFISQYEGFNNLIKHNALYKNNRN